MESAHFKVRAVYLLLILISPLLARGQLQQRQQQPQQQAASGDGSSVIEDELDAAASELVRQQQQQQQLTSATSHEILASGWPATSHMWPSIETDESVAGSARLSMQQFEPFIYADKPNELDYSLLLSLNATLIHSFKTNLRLPIVVELSFEYYFNHADTVSGLPNIKIEVDRKETKYVLAVANKTRMWIRHTERLMLSDLAKLDKPDWLKLSLVNRESPSLVAIRRLRVSFANEQLASNQAPVSPAGPSQTPASSGVPNSESLPATPAAPSAPEESSSSPSSPSAPPIQQADSGAPQAVPGAAQPPAQQPNPPAPADSQQSAPSSDASPETPSVSPPAGSDPTKAAGPQEGEQAPSSPVEPQEEIPQASNVIASTIKPVSPKRKGWSSLLGRRRKREAAVVLAEGQQSVSRNGSGSSTTSSYTLTCYNSDSCEHWKVDGSQSLIQWSLARMPPSTSAVKNGYYYASNRRNYGDATKMLRLSLNQTESATILDQNSDHCLELALYVTELARLKLYKLINRNSPLAGQLSPTSSLAINAGDHGDQWLRGNLLLTWAPTVSSHQLAGAGKSREGNTSGSNSTSGYLDQVHLIERPHLNGAALMASNQSGWTLETICFGDFFHNVKECAQQNHCALGFEMEFVQQQANIDSKDDRSESNELVPAASNSLQQPDSTADSQLQEGEQVVGVALLRQHAVNIPNNKQLTPARWLEMWQRAEVEPDDNWRFYPKLDYHIQADNVSLANLYDGAHYAILSDWLLVAESLNFEASFLIELIHSGEQDNFNGSSGSIAEANSLQQTLPAQSRESPTAPLFKLNIQRKIVDSNFDSIYTLNSTIDWFAHYNTTRLALFNMSLADVSEQIKLARHGKLFDEADLPASQLFKIVIELSLALEHATMSSEQPVDLNSKQPIFRLTLSNVSLADRCHPNPCQFGTCQQNGTAPNDWLCQCDSSHRGRRCEFGRWCSLAHVAPPTQLQAQQQQQQQQQSAQQVGNPLNSNQQKRPSDSAQGQLVVLRQQQQQQQPAAALASSQQAIKANKLLDGLVRLTGREFCQRKLGAGSKCTELDLPLDEQLYLEEEKTFTCSCQDDYYLSDDAKCKQAHQCNSIVCPSIGQVCDESKPFNRTQPCQCNEKQDWYADPEDGSKCVRRQCHDKRRDCGFDAHICLPTLPGERPICKCAPKFALKTSGEKGRETRACKSAACVLPTLNDCQHLCLPNDSSLERPFTCACHEGFTLDKEDGRTCRPNKAGAPARCKPACDQRTQICTEHGCRCKQGFIPDGETIVQLAHNAKSQAAGSNASATIDYVKSVRCLNVCSLSYAENKLEFEKIESVCPLGLCDPGSFNCRCSDPSSSALVQTKYEPIWSNETLSGEDPDDAAQVAEKEDGDTPEVSANEIGADSKRKRSSPLCHLKRVCQPHSAAYKLCRARGAICVPDYTKPLMYDCVCAPGSERRARGSAGDFNCEPRCSSIRQECLKKQAICRPIEKDQVRCDCLPGMILDQHDQRCYLARFTYAVNLIIVNKYYEPESRFHKLLGAHNATTSSSSSSSSSTMKPTEAEDGKESEDGQPGAHLHEILPEFQRALGFQRDYRQQPAHQHLRSVFIAHFNQCNITQLIPEAILKDPYEHNPATFLQYIDQCNERIHQTSRTHNLNSRLSEDLRQSLRQHLRDFTVTTNNTLCQEISMAANGHHDSNRAPSDLHKLEPTYLNCTIYLQSQEPIDEAAVTQVFTSCDKHGADERFCWVKPRLLLLKGDQHKLAGSGNATTNSNATNPFHFRQVVACEMGGFCGEDAYSLRLDERTSLCSCKCPADIEMIDLKELEPRGSRALIVHPTGGAAGTLARASLRNSILALEAAGSGGSGGAIKEICAPRNHCGANSTYCQFKTGSVCQYDIRTGARCNCLYPSYENEQGHCVEVAFSRLDNTLIVLIILIGTCLIVSFVINLYALARSRRGLFGHTKEYPLSEFTSSTHATPGERISPGSSTNNRNNSNNGASRPLNRSTGMPNLAFDPND